MNLVRYLCRFLPLFVIVASVDLCAGELGEHPFFKSITGEWSGEGDLTAADGQVIPVREEWTGAETDEGFFEMSGHRMMGDDHQEFRWVFSRNAATELIECRYWHTGMDEELGFEVQLTEKQADLRTPFGEPGGELRISNRFEERKITGEVEVTEASGITTLTGEVIYQRKS
ncbi:MAG: hypothetical protein HRU46_10150 [Verrucomicrobiales bacterium]|nr:hypothetical protein [Verrucomicrobiales bacterium]